MTGRAQVATTSRMMWMLSASSRCRSSNGIPALDRNHLAGIHDVLRVERALDRAHELECRRRMLFQHVFHLGLADAVLAGAGAAHFEAASHQAFEKVLHALDFIWIVHVDQRT